MHVVTVCCAENDLTVWLTYLWLLVWWS